MRLASFVRFLPLVFAFALAFAPAQAAAQTLPVEPTAVAPLPPLPPPVPPPTPPPAVVAPPSCSEGWAARVYRESRGSVVRIEDLRSFGAGFVMFSPTYVATAAHVVALGRPLVVTAADGSHQHAKVVAIDPENDVALLELEHPFPGAAPLVPASAPPVVGSPVLAIGHPLAIGKELRGRLSGLLAWTATEGIVSDTNEGYVQMDAPVNPGNSGGPLLGCDGRVLGVVSQKVNDAEGLALAVSIARVKPLPGKVGKGPDYKGAWSRSGMVALPIQVDRSSTWLGGALGVGGIRNDRWWLGARAGVLGAVRTPGAAPEASPGGGPEVHDGGVRILGELDVSYRAVLMERPKPFYFVAGAGAAFTYTWLTQTTLGLAPAPGCTPSGSTVCANITSTDSEQKAARLWPMVSAGLLFTDLLVTYAFQLDVDSVSDSTHRVLIGVEF